MVDYNQKDSNGVVCCLCGDVGFQEKLFRCNKCSYRFQHSYCSNYYEESKDGFCDWCLSEEKTSKHIVRVSSKKSSNTIARNSNSTNNKSEQYSGEKIKRNDNKEATEKAKNTASTSGAPSPKTSGRRYKFLKDVMC